MIEYLRSIRSAEILLMATLLVATLQGGGEIGCTAPSCSTEPVSTSEDSGEVEEAEVPADGRHGSAARLGRPSPSTSP